MSLPGKRPCHPQPVLYTANTPRRWRRWFATRGRLKKNIYEFLDTQYSMMGRLRQLPDHGLLAVPARYQTHPDVPLFDVIRFDNVISHDDQVAIQAAASAMDPAKVVWERPTSRHKVTREDPPFEDGVATFPAAEGKGSHGVLHVGVWDRYGNGQRVTSSTAQRRPAARVAVLTVMAVIDRVLRGELRDQLFALDPRAVNRVEQTVSNLQYELVNIEPSELEQVEAATGGKALQMGLLGTTMALVYGASSSFHVDPNDFTDRCYTLVIAVSPDGWDTPSEPTCYVELPQLRMRVPLRPGQALAFRSATLIHRVTPINPVNAHKRFAITVFTDSNMGTGTRIEPPPLALNNIRIGQRHPSSQKSTRVNRCRKKGSNMCRRKCKCACTKAKRQNKALSRAQALPPASYPPARHVSSTRSRGTEPVTAMPGNDTAQVSSTASDGTGNASSTPCNDTTHVSSTASNGPVHVSSKTSKVSDRTLRDQRNAEKLHKQQADRAQVKAKRRERALERKLKRQRFADAHPTSSTSLVGNPTCRPTSPTPSIIAATVNDTLPTSHLSDSRARWLHSESPSPPLQV